LSDENDLGDEGMKNISEALKKDSHLTTLELGNLFFIFFFEWGYF